MFSRVSGKENSGVIHLKSGIFLFVMDGWVLECLMPEYAFVLARSVRNPIPRLLRWQSWNAPSNFVVARQTIHGAEDSYSKSAREWIDNKPSTGIPMFPSRVDDGENVPGFLAMTMALKKMNKKNCSRVKPFGRAYGHARGKGGID
ncbi:hypothetical protein LIER_17616 [Lithospermum erythrorhizon]|uniref:Uncharacterized protein n=1 Tax=Lithospermum erythrorhizon TaxID=34254 RepID=A0AAV3QAX6_LITER